MGQDRAFMFGPEPGRRAAPEMQLVLACARAQLNPAAAEEIVSAAGQPIDWLKSRRKHKTVLVSVLPMIQIAPLRCRSGARPIPQLNPLSLPKGKGELSFELRVQDFRGCRIVPPIKFDIRRSMLDVRCSFDDPDSTDSRSSVLQRRSR